MTPAVFAKRNFHSDKTKLLALLGRMGSTRLHITDDREVEDSNPDQDKVKVQFLGKQKLEAAIIWGDKGNATTEKRQAPS